MAREQEEYEEEEEQETEEEEETPAPVAKKPVAKKPMPSAKPQKPSAPQVKFVKIPVFESQAQQVFYDQLLLIDQKLDKMNADLELMKKYLPQE